ncbi:MAG: UDP-N-acetylmuramoyl-L-alanine--D-glutamate ligase [Acutalibacteraceae bacterium]|nr:UDP-N-acetylmuramoyl-L-alanine--D-glutamate ligase [Acutalibacteraceae bacterium]
MDTRRFWENISSKKIAMLGIGVSNTPLIMNFLDKGARVYACDRRSRQQIGELADKLEAAGAELKLGEDYLENLEVDIIFRTPGMSFYLPELTAARKKGIAVTSEMEVFFDLCPATIFAVTGSDGKTTTTTLIAEMLKAQGKKVHVGGNIGNPLLPEIDNISPDDFVVVELSSFQLISMRKSPDVAVVTNVTPNHLDVHKDMDEYVEAKKNIILHQNAFSRTVLNLDNEITAGFKDFVRGQSLGFSMERRVKNGAWLDSKGTLHMSYRGIDAPIMSKKDITILGDHNVENYLTAIAAVWGYVSAENIRKVAKEFAGVEHRIEFVREVDGVKYYNDSIASSPTRTIAGLKAFDRKVILLAGGYDKHIPFEPMAPYVTSKVKTLLLCGPTADAIEAAVKADTDYSEGNPEIIRTKDLAESIKIAHEKAVSGDIVTLSPACASFDAFPNFAARGKFFKEKVMEL